MENQNKATSGKVIPPGYKLTEVGVIPEDWLLQKLGLHASFRTGPFGSALHKSDYVDGGIPVVNPMQIVDGKVVPTFSMAISGDAAKKLAEFRLSVGDVVIGRRGDMGRCAVITEKENGWLCGTGSMIIRVKPSCDAAFLQRILSSASVISAIENTSVGTTMINLNQGTLRELQIVLPKNKNEQTAIANVLSDTDVLITELEKLIAKKQAIKTATMQQLLTGRTRLPQFSKNPDGTIKGYKSSELGYIPEDWEVVKLKDVCFFENGDRSSNYPTPDSFVESGIPFINAGHIGEGIINQRGMNFITYKAFEKLGGGKVKPNDILFCLRGSLGKFGIVPDNFGIGAIASSLVIIRTKQQVLLLDYFASGYLKSSICEDMIELWAGGAAQPNLGARELGNFLLPLPSVSEQRSIATILSDMDAELAALERKLAKFLDIKQGMMQQLLTGRIRLPLEQQP